MQGARQNCRRAPSRPFLIHRTDLTNREHTSRRDVPISQCIVPCILWRQTAAPGYFFWDFLDLIMGRATRRLADFLKAPPPRHLSVIQLSIIQRRSHYCNMGRVAEILCNKSLCCRNLFRHSWCCKKKSSLFFQHGCCWGSQIAAQTMLQKYLSCFFRLHFFPNMVVVAEGYFATHVMLQKERREGYVYTRHIEEAGDRLRAIRRMKARVSLLIIPYQ